MGTEKETACTRTKESWKKKKRVLERWKGRAERNGGGQVREGSREEGRRMAAEGGWLGGTRCRRRRVG